jgi:hypothetical protein
MEQIKDVAKVEQNSSAMNCPLIQIINVREKVSEQEAPFDLSRHVHEQVGASHVLSHIKY